MSRSNPFAFSIGTRGFLREKAPFLPPLALPGYVPMPTFRSYCPQTPLERYHSSVQEAFLCRCKIPPVRAALQSLTLQKPLRRSRAFFVPPRRVRSPGRTLRPRPSCSLPAVCLPLLHEFFRELLPHAQLGLSERQRLLVRRRLV
jgi:hypothetical protein